MFGMWCVFICSLVGLFCFDLWEARDREGRRKKEIKLNRGGENLGELGEKMFGCAWETL